jgi:hypothetical protein
LQETETETGKETETEVVEDIVQEAVEFNRRHHHYNARSGEAIKAEISSVLRLKIKRAKSKEKLWGIIIKHERNLNVSLLCLAVVNLRKLAKTSRRGARANHSSHDAGRNSKVEAKGIRVLEALIARRTSTMTAKHVATILHSMAVMRMTENEELRHRLIDRFLLLADSANGQSIGNMLWACGKLQDCLEVSDLEMLANRLLAVSSSCNSQNLSNTIWALGTMNQSINDHTLELLLSCYICKVHESVPQGMSNVLWAIARLDFNPQSDIISRIVGELMSRPRGEVKAQDLANSIWSIGRLQCDAVDERSLRKMILTAVDLVETFNQQELSLTLWGLARLNYELEDELYAKILDVVYEKCHTFNSQALSTTLWSIGRIGVIPPPDVLLALTEEVSYKIRSFTPQGLSNVLWALTTLSYNPGPRVLQSISHEVARKSRHISSKNLSSIMKSFSLLKYLPPEKEMQKLTESFLREVSISSPQTICLLLWSYANLDYCPGMEVLDILHARACKILDQYTTIHLANTVFSYAKLGFDPSEAFLKRLADLFVLNLGDSSATSSQAIANLVWAISSLGYTLGSEQFTPILAEVCSRTSRNEFSALELTNVLWAFSVGDYPSSLCRTAEFEELWMHTLKSAALICPGKKLAQIFQSKLLLEASQDKLLPKASQGGGGGGDSHSHLHDDQNMKYALPDDIHVLAEQSWNTITNRGREDLSRFHVQVSSTLKRLGIPHELEQLTRNKYLSVDILVRDWDLVIEVDGPSHYSSNTLKVNGSTLARNRLLKHWSYSVLCIPYFGWPSEEAEQDKLLRSTLRPYRRNIKEPPPPSSSSPLSGKREDQEEEEEEEERH